MPPATPPATLSALAPYIPAPGQSANISFNDLSAINPCPANNCWYSGSSKQAAGWRNWTGAAFASGYSPHGAMIFWGGGHGGGNDSSLYLFDFTTGKWSRLGPNNPGSDYTGSDGQSGLDASFYDYLYEGSRLVPALHSYNYPAYAPPGVSGSGAKGSWVIPQLVGGSNSGAKPHAVDLATGIWSRFSTGAGSSAQQPYAGSIEDTRRNKLWWASMEQSTINMLDWNQSHPRTVQTLPVLPKGSVHAFGGYYARHVYVPESDMAVGFWCQYGKTGILGEVLDFSSGRPVIMAGARWPAMEAVGAGFGVDWCSATQAFYIYEGFGAKRVLKLKPSSLEFHECSWTWSEESFANAAWEPTGQGDGRGGAQALSRWRYIPWLKCFAWSDGPGFKALCVDGMNHDGVMQLWRPLGS